MSDQQTIALVTGASSGLGAEFVHQLAPRCSRVIAVARRAGRLEQLAAELAPVCAVDVLVADLATAEGQGRVVEAIRQRGPLRYLVNNAGFGTFGRFIDCDIDTELAMLRVHQDATLLLTRAALPFMRDNGGGYIINTASIGAFLPMPSTAVYGATKAFLSAFSVSLQAEVAAQGVRVQALCPGLVRTEIHDADTFAGFDKTRLPEQLWMDADAVVAQSLQALDTESVVVVPGSFNLERVQAALAELAAGMHSGH
jgi:short-subunit dehydrogenase